MKPTFSKNIDPIFLHVLELLERIGSNESPDPGEERARIRARLDAAEQHVGQTEEWQLTKYAIVAWVDEMLIDAPWDGADWWREQPLEFEIFRSAVAFSGFYEKAEQASQLTRKDALEVFYICVVLGFRGMYKDPTTAEGAIRSMDYDLPATMEGWAKRYGVSIQVAQDVPLIDERVYPGEGAPWRDGKFLSVGSWSIAAMLAAALAAVIIWKMKAGLP